MTGTLRRTKIFPLQTQFSIALENHKQPFIANKGIQPICAFQMRE